MEQVNPSRYMDSLNFVELMLTSIHVYADTVPMLCDYFWMSQERTLRLVWMLERYGFVKRVDDYIWLTRKGNEWREFLNKYLSN
jgi:hypothetical protein